jgi:galactose mutarotase-like enzyme
MSEEVTLQAGTIQARVSPADGGRIVSLVVGGRELLGGVGQVVVEHGSFVMAPWAGRIRDGVLHVGGQEHHLPTDRTHPHAGHGLVMDRSWSTREVSADRVLLRCELDSRWPFPGYVEQEIVLREDRIDQSVWVHALETPFPATIGWHPWFLRDLGDGVRAELEFAADGMLLRDEAGIPDGTVVPVPPGPWDDCFVGVRWPMTITWPGLLKLQIQADVPYAVVYDEREEAFCVEPQSGPPDGPNTDPQLAAPGAPVCATTSWSWA